MAEKDTVFPVSKGPTHCHLPGQPLHTCVLGIQTLLPLPGPLPITEACLEHSDPVESLRHLCNKESNYVLPHARLRDELEASLR